MINFNKNTAWNLTPINLNSIHNEVAGLMVNGERPLMAFKTIRDQLVFTNKRIISIDVQGITGKRRSFTSLPLLASGEKGHSGSGKKGQLVVG